MNKYRLQINNIEQYARKYWDNSRGKLAANAIDYIEYMNNDTSELHDHICDPLVTANHWGNNCNIPKEDFTVQEIDENNDVVKTYSYQEVWDQLPKMKVRYKSEMEKVGRKNIDTLLEPLTDLETGKVVCMTNYGNHMFMMHTELLEDFINKSELESVIECPVYLLEKANNQPNGVLNKYFDKN